MIAARNIGLWFLSVLLAVGLFSLAFSTLNDVAGGAAFVFRITMKFALPVAFLYLPVVITQRDAEEGRMRVIAGWGIVIGPVAMIVMGLILVLRGEPHAMDADPVAPVGLEAFLLFSFIVGTLTTILYITALKLVHYLTSASKPVSIH
jgi:Na+/glutamate symporter